MEMLRVIDSAWRGSKIPGGAVAFLQGHKDNWRAFWKARRARCETEMKRISARAQ